MADELLPQVDVDRDLDCRASDGTVLRADVYSPKARGRFPALLYRLPYGKTTADSSVAMPHPAWVAAQGFVVAVQDVRGRGTSDGVFQPLATEAADGASAVEWTAGLERCDGRVITYGFSYPGLIQLLTAARRPRGLVAICPTFTGSSAGDGWTSQGGALAGFVLEWATGLGAEQARRAGDLAAFHVLRGQLATGYAWPPADPDAPVVHALRRYSGWVEEWAAHIGDIDFWEPTDAVSRYERIDVPALHIGGWWDRFVRGTIQNFTGLRAAAATAEVRSAQRLVLGPWPHMPWSPLGEPVWSAVDPPAGGHVADLHLQWWRQVLHGEAAPLLAAPVTAWVSGSGWQTLDAWPGATTQQSWHLHSGGRAASRYGDGRLDPRPAEEEPADVLAYDPWMAPIRTGGHGCCLPGIAPIGPACQCTAEEMPTMLVYTGEPLEEPLTLLGDVAVELWTSFDTPSMDVTARLCVVDEAGCSRALLDGVVRQRAGAERPVRIDLGPVGRRLARGERVRLQLAASDHPLWDVNAADGSEWGLGSTSLGRSGTRVIWHDLAHPSRLLLPVMDSTAVSGVAPTQRTLGG